MTTESADAMDGSLIVTLIAGLNGPRKLFQVFGLSITTPIFRDHRQSLARVDCAWLLGGDHNLAAIGQ